ncbi:spore germination protein [Alicyclobacillus tolerans]|uniref:spore germination protein n=1 Tax=Alicyclobacillus tolerans TaxID=90970 RepID=UPI001F34AD28|nr:spore germination protein [Alicyclobacillus tolerans]MCF8567986.1 spore germination protein [Alicyclobacillus tolerans]
MFSKRTIREQQVSVRIEENERLLRETFKRDPQVIIQPLQVHASGNTTKKLLWIGIEGLIDKDELYLNVFTPLNTSVFPGRNFIQEIENAVGVKQIEIERQMQKCLEHATYGNVILFVDGEREALVIHMQGFAERAIEESAWEPSVRGSHEGFVESITTNLMLIRKRIHSTDVRVEPLFLGDITKTQLSIVYLESIADLRLVQRMKERLSKINIDSILCSGEVEQAIEDNHRTLFATIGNTERPDKIADIVLEGRVALLVDGDPTALYAPYFFIDAFKSQEDYSSRPYYVSFIRLLRFFSFVIAVLAPAYYIFALNFHKEMIPTALVSNFQRANERSPFPTIIEVLIMLGMFEVVREAGIRLPKSVGSAVSIVGALILGQVSVDAGIVSAPTIIAVAVSIIAGFVLTPVADVVSLLRLINILAAGLFGAFGVLMVMMTTVLHMVSLTSLGEPYLAPFAPLHFEDWKDSVVRVGIQKNRNRPHSVPQRRTVKIRHLPGDDEQG